MNRLKQFLSQSFRQRDWLAVVIFAGAVLIAAWIVSMPFCNFSRRLSLQRFHLANPSYVGWAAMAPIPAMYNFENRIQFSNEMVGDATFDTGHESWMEYPLNHFPARAMTFGDFSPRCFSDDRFGTFEMTSKYQGTELVTRWEIREDANGVLTVYRLSEKWDIHDESK